MPNQNGLLFLYPYVPTDMGIGLDTNNGYRAAGSTYGQSAAIASASHGRLRTVDTST
jgi:hypothetical protein